jgi:ATP-dependent RNA helicase RhlE
MDLMNQGFVDLRAVQTLVLDEADRMLDMGFINDIQLISAKLPAKRQTLLFSATIPTEIRRLAGRLLRDPATVHIAAECGTADHIEQSVYHVERAHKPALLTHLLEHKPMHRTIVFTRTRHGADRLVKHLQRTDIGADAIHGDKSQNSRKRTLDSFRRGRLHVLVATDVASRGIDVDGITHVVNYDVSMDPESYVHRIGRTARAGASGVAISFCDRAERGQLRAIERLIGRPIPVCDEHPEYPKVSAAPAAQVRHPQFKDADGNKAGHATAPRSDRRQPYQHHAAGTSSGGQAGGGKRKPRRGRSRTGRGAYSTSHA